MGDDGVGVYYVVAGVNGRSWAQDPNGRAVHGLTFIVGDGQIRDTRKTAFGPWVKVRGGRL